MGIFGALTTAVTGVRAQPFAFLESPLPSKPAADNESARRAFELDLIETNKRRIEQEIDDGTVEVSSLPYTIQFSPEHRCNLRCVMCASTVLRNQGITPLMDRRLPNNTLERFKKLEPYIPYFQTVALTGSGEPLLSPALPDILDILSKYTSVSIAFTTHAQIFDRDRAELLVRSGVHEIAISMDGACKETYEKIRVHAKWEKLLRTIDLLNQVKRKRQSVTPHICFAMNCMRQNIEELPALVDFARAHGGHKIAATTTLIYDIAMRHEALIHYPELTRQMVVETIRRAKRFSIQFDNRILEPPEGVRALEAEALALESANNPPPILVKIAGLRQRLRPLLRHVPAPVASVPSLPKKERADILKACQMPWTGLMVESDGNVKVCCYNSPYVGNLNKQPLEEIWNGAPIKALRRSFLVGRPPEGCRNCVIFAKSHDREEQFFQLTPTRFSNIDYPAEGTTLHGSVEIRGWAVDQKLVSKIEIVINDITAGDAALGVQRPDVEKVYPKFENSATSGFSFDVDTRMFADGYHMLALRIFNEDGESVEVDHRTVEVRNTEALGYNGEVELQAYNQDSGWEILNPDVSIHNRE